MAIALPETEQISADESKKELIALVTGMYETLSDCSRLLDLDIKEAIDEKMRQNERRYDEKQCRVSTSISM